MKQNISGWDEAFFFAQAVNYGRAKKARMVENCWRVTFKRVCTWWLIPLSKWVITPVINGISRVNPLIIGIITHLLSGMSHQVALNLTITNTVVFFLLTTCPK